MSDARDGTRERIIALLGSAHRAGHGLALVFDYDGTLAPIAEQPHLALLPPGTRAALAELAALPRVVAGVISGRALADLKEMVGLPGLCYAGTSGLEIEVQGERLEHPRAAEFQERAGRLEESLQAAVASNPGAWIERKPAGLTVHYRGVAAERVPDLRHAVRSVLGPAAPGWRVIDGLMAIEVTPAEGWTKSRALRAICARLGPGAIPLYAGDHQNDADALKAAAGMGGITIGIGPEAPAARYRLPDPAALAGLISGIAAAFRARVSGLEIELLRQARDMRVE